MSLRDPVTLFRYRPRMENSHSKRHELSFYGLVFFQYQSRRETQITYITGRIYLV